MAITQRLHGALVGRRHVGRKGLENAPLHVAAKLLHGLREHEGAHVFEKVDEDKQMGDDQQKQVSTETKAERKLRLKKAQLKKHLAEQKLGISKCKYLYSTVSWLR
jgi:hypothetical protein